MDNREDLKEFLDQIQKVKDEELKKQELLRKSTNGNSSGETLNQVISIIQPIVEIFVKSDSLLHLQKTPTERFNGFYLNYANVKSLQLKINVFGPNIELQATRSDPVHSEDVSVYSGTFDEEQIKKSVQEQLINWYRVLKALHVRWRREN